MYEKADFVFWIEQLSNAECCNMCFFLRFYIKKVREFYILDKRCFKHNVCECMCILVPMCRNCLMSEYRHLDEY
jgi:hypothetical protein